jgi:hypothetical protein
MKNQALRSKIRREKSAVQKKAIPGADGKHVRKDNKPAMVNFWKGVEYAIGAQSHEIIQTHSRGRRELVSKDVTHLNPNHALVS